MGIDWRGGSVGKEEESMVSGKEEDGEWHSAVF
jgi:hypothetical protein